MGSHWGHLVVTNWVWFNPWGVFLTGGPTNSESSPWFELLISSCKRMQFQISSLELVLSTQLQNWASTCLLLNELIRAARRCPSPQLVPNGELDYEDTVFQSTINYTCHEGWGTTIAVSLLVFYFGPFCQFTASIYIAFSPFLGFPSTWRSLSALNFLSNFFYITHICSLP